MCFTSFSKLGIILKMRFCAETPRKSWCQAIGSLDPRGGGLAGIPVAPAALSARGGVRVDHMLSDGQRRPPRRLRLQQGEGARVEMRDLGWCCGLSASYSRAWWPRGEARRRLAGGGHGAAGERRERGRAARGGGASS
jgi:hypothetical protein